MNQLQMSQRIEELESQVEELNEQIQTLTRKAKREAVKTESAERESDELSSKLYKAQ